LKQPALQARMATNNTVPKYIGVLFPKTGFFIVFSPLAAIFPFTAPIAENLSLWFIYKVYLYNITLLFIYSVNR
jgi:hypothetical protein